jgi:hypothetical protein
MYYQIHDSLIVTDEENGLYCELKIGSVKKRTCEYFEGEILRHGQLLCKINGNYCGYIDFDGVRYYDEREIPAMWKEYVDVPENQRLPSDSCHRDDMQLLAIGAVPQA